MLEWFDATGAVAVAAVLIFVPGAVVLTAGFGWSPRALVGAPSLSAALIAVSATVAPIVRLRWSVLPVVLVTTVVAVVVGWMRHRWWQGAHDPYARVTWWAAIVGGGLGALLIAWQLVHAFVGPTEISQTFDNVAHLNMVRSALDTGSASGFDIGTVAGVPFYPNGWSSLASLVAATAGVSVPIAVNGTNIVIGALVWPASCVALAVVVFRGSSAAALVAGVLSSAFGAFPILLFDFGVLYPNAYGYALLPAVLAVGVELLGVADPERRRLRGEVIRLGVLLLALVGGLGLAHPNAFLALLALAAPLLIPWAIQRNRSGDIVWRHRLSPAVVVCGVYACFAIIWLLARTPFALSRWAPWQSQAQALGEALLVAPRTLPLTLTVSGFALLGAMVSLRHRRGYVVLLPWAVAIVLFVLAAGTSTNNYVREAITNPWNNDPYRLAALLPAAAIPVITAGVLAVVRLVARGFDRRRVRLVWIRVAAAISLVALVAASQGPNVWGEVRRARAVYESTPQTTLLTPDERALLDRLDDETPADALIAGNPRTGTALAYALADRRVVEPHIFTQITDGERYLDLNLAHIETDPRVCEAVDQIGVDYVLDFGRQDVHNQQDQIHDYDGIQNLHPSAHLVLVDSQGAQARLFQIKGC